MNHINCPENCSCHQPPQVSESGITSSADHSAIFNTPKPQEKHDYEILVNTILDTKNNEIAQNNQKILKEIEGLKKFPELGQDVPMAEGKDVSKEVRMYNQGYNEALIDVKRLLK